MATITIRNLSDELIERLKLRAARNGRSMEQEVRELLRERCMTKPEAVQRIRERWKSLPKTSAAEVEAWRSTGRE